MTNIQHQPVAQIGSYTHRLCTLSKTRGIVSGATSVVPGTKHTTAEVIEGFDYLSLGDVKTFKAETEVEILEFDSDNIQARGVFNPYIRRIRMNLKAGATLTGPITWRKSPETHSPEKNAATPVEMGIGSFVMIAGLLLMIAGLVYASITATTIILVVVAIAGLIGWAKSAIRNSHYKRIAKFGSGYVLAPEKKFWV